MAARLPLRLARRQINPAASRRTFTSTPYFLEAQNFTMPAMSPTMTEGNISSWKVKEGDSFSTGDVLLEIETDKASMDIEAQDDGIVAKIIQADGAKGIQVGSRIGVLAEPGDDVSSLEIPADESKAADQQAKKSPDSGSEPATPQPAPPAPSKSSSEPAAASTKPPSRAGQNSKYPLYPAVAALIRETHMPGSEVAKIPATGPSGRLLKGDVLSYLGRIKADYSSTQSKRITQLAHLDLSNIKKAGRSEDQAEPQSARPAPKSAPRARPAQTSISLPVSLAEVLKVQRRMEETLNISMPLSTFLGRAVDHANDDLPKSKHAQPSANELFNAILGLDSIPTTSRGGYIPQITAVASPPLSSGNNIRSAARSAPPRAPKKTADIIDILRGKSQQPPSSSSSSSSKPDPETRSARPRSGIPINANPSTHGALNHFTLTVPAGEEGRARVFLERVKTVLQVEPGRLVL